MPAILFISRWYPLHSGHFIQKVAQAVSAYSNVIVLTVIPDPELKRLSFRMSFVKETDNGIDTLRVHYPHGSRHFFLTGLINMVFYQIALLQGLMFFSRKNIQFDLIHIHILTRAAVLPFLMKLLFRKPYVITEYWTRYLAENNQYQGWLRKKVTAIIVRNADGMIAISDYLRMAMGKQGIRNRNFKVIPPAVDTSLFTLAGSMKEAPKKRFIHISTFSDQAKNINGILRMVRKLSECRRDFECHLIGGESPFEEQAKSLAQELGLEEPLLYFRGIKFGEELVREIQHAQFLVMFSNYETFSLVIQECLSCGKPIVASNTGPIPDIVDQHSGILVNPCDEVELLNAVNFMLDHYQDYDANLMHEKVQNTFGFMIVGKAYCDLYESVLAKTSTSSII